MLADAQRLRALFVPGLAAVLLGLTAVGCLGSKTPAVQPTAGAPNDAGRDSSLHNRDGGVAIDGGAHRRCRSGGDGGRFGTHTPEPQDEWAQDCGLDLLREYWRVFERPSGRAYMIPRPDGHAALVEPCVDAKHPLNKMLMGYTLCESKPDAATINAMDTEDGLAIARLLHDQLAFTSDADGIYPAAMPSDILDICETNDWLRNDILPERCDFEADAAEAGERSEQAWNIGRSQGRELAGALNSLYGIAGEPLCQRLKDSARGVVERAAARAVESTSCQEDSDCTTVYETCSNTCMIVPSAARSRVDDSVALVASRECVAFGASPPRPVDQPIQSQSQLYRRGDLLATLTPSTPSRGMASSGVGHGARSPVNSPGLKRSMKPKTQKLWDKQDQHQGDRWRLFGAVAEAVHAEHVLYPGCYVDIAPSFVFPSVTYLDIDKRAAAFFGDSAGVLEIIARHDGPPDTHVAFVHADYTNGLDLPERHFDLLVSLYAGFISEHCTRHLKVGGTLLVNPSHGDAAMASIDPRYELSSVVVSRAGKYSVDARQLDRYLVPKKPQTVTAVALHKSGRGIGYTKSPFAYLFTRVA